MTRLLMRLVMRPGLIVIVSCSLAACTQSGDADLRARLDSHSAVLRELPRDFYEPGLGDLMHALQLRHAKLWFAGAHENWALAGFELHEIHENLDRVARWHADHEDVPMAPSIKTYMQAGRQALQQSIERKNADEFTTAFDRFTDGCNRCHQAAQHGFIVIQRPTTQPWSNQQWAPSAE